MPTFRDDGGNDVKEQRDTMLTVRLSRRRCRIRLLSLNVSVDDFSISLMASLNAWEESGGEKENRPQQILAYRQI